MMAYMSKDSDNSKAVDKTEGDLPEGGSVKFLKAEFLLAVKTKVQSAVRAAKREVFQTTVENMSGVYSRKVTRRWKNECRTSPTNLSNSC